MDLPNSHQQLLLTDLQNHNQTMLPTSDYPLQQSPPNNASNPHLVYVRRKSESQLYCHEDIAPPKPHSKDPKVSSFPMPSGKPAIMLPPHTTANPKVFNYVHWEDHYQHLQMFLTKLDRSDQADYIHMLQSLSSVELSKHAVELEKRSIQLSLEEAKELQRVAALNVLGKSVKNFKAPADHGECSDKLKTLT